MIWWSYRLLKSCNFAWHDPRSKINFLVHTQESKGLEVNDSIMKSIDLKMYLFEKFCSTLGWHFSELLTDRKLSNINQNGRNFSLLKLVKICWQIFQTINYILVGRKMSKLFESCLKNPRKPQVWKIFEKRNIWVSDHFTYGRGEIKIFLAFMFCLVMSGFKFDKTNNIWHL